MVIPKQGWQDRVAFYFQLKESIIKSLFCGICLNFGQGLIQVTLAAAQDSVGCCGHYT